MDDTFDYFDDDIRRNKDEDEIFNELFRSDESIINYNKEEKNGQ